MNGINRLTGVPMYEKIKALIDACTEKLGLPESMLIENELEAAQLELAQLEVASVIGTGWSTATPTTDGYYWAIEPGTEERTIVELSEGQFYVTGWEGDVNPDHYNYWLGPLPQPPAPNL
jgi:hypothetical protein